ncbi:MAG TPA: cupin domain-containing protein [Nitrospiria bacterium]|nr:cupin domain-containing protein [Nitrospiria bacterium]
MQVLNVNDVKAFSPEKMKKVNLFDGKHLFCDLYCFEPGQAQKPHAHEGEDKIYYVLEGEGKFRVGNDERALTPQSIVLAPAGVEHGVVNEGKGRLTLLVFMAPPPHHHH